MRALLLAVAPPALTTASNAQGPEFCTSALFDLSHRAGPPSKGSPQVYQHRGVLRVHLAQQSLTAPTWRDLDGGCPDGVGGVAERVGVSGECVQLVWKRKLKLKSR